jgi:hypothetical protein
MISERDYTRKFAARQTFPRNQSRDHVSQFDCHPSAELVEKCVWILTDNASPFTRADGEKLSGVIQSATVKWVTPARRHHRSPSISGGYTDDFSRRRRHARSAGRPAGGELQTGLSPPTIAHARPLVSGHRTANYAMPILNLQP